VPASSRALGVIPLGYVEPEQKRRRFYNTKRKVVGTMKDVQRYATAHSHRLFPDRALSGSGNQIDSLHALKSLMGLTLFGLVSHSSTLRSTVGGTARFLLFRPALPFTPYHFASPIIFTDRASHDL
jgi:hypothetical protein